MGLYRKLKGLLSEVEGGRPHGSIDRAGLRAAAAARGFDDCKEPWATEVARAQAKQTKSYFGSTISVGVGVEANVRFGWKVDVAAIFKGSRPYSDGAGFASSASVLHTDRSATSFSRAGRAPSRSKIEK